MASSKRSKDKTNGTGHHRHGLAHFTTEIIKFELDRGPVDCLISWLILTTDEAEKIRQAPNKFSSNKLLLNILQERPYNTFRIFIEALKTSDPLHKDLFDEMTNFVVKDETPHVKYGDVSIQIDNFAVRLQKCYKTLVDQLTSTMQICDILLELEAFNGEDYEDINSLSTLYKKNRKLLSKIVNNGKVGYNTFLKALKKSDDFRNQELATEIENTEISDNDILLLQIGIKLSRENQNIPSNIREIVQQMTDNWEQEDAAFVETRGTEKVLNDIGKKNCITIVGSSGSGKTSVMRHAVLNLKYKKGFQVCPVDSPDEIIEYRNSDSKQIFLIDDALGKYAVDPILVDKWEQLDDEIQNCLDRTPGHMKLLFTLRKQVVKNAKFKYCSSIITQNIVDLEDDQIALSRDEKNQILAAHLNINNMLGSLTEDDKEEACASEYAFPLLCKIVSSNEEILKNITKFFREPFSVLELELGKLWTNNKEVYCSLVLCMLSNGKIGKDFFKVNSPTPEMFRIVTEACGLPTNVSRKTIEESLTSTIGTYVCCENGIFHFMHDAFLESISSHFAKMNPEVMFAYCNIDLIRDRVRINSRLFGDDENVIVIGQENFEVITRRILTECEEGRFSNVLLSNVIRNQQFVDCFGVQLQKKKRSFKALMMKVSKERHNKKLMDLFLNVWHSSSRADKNKKVIVENNAIKEVIRAPSRQSTLIHWMLASGSYILFNYFWEKVSKHEQKELLSRDWFYPLTNPFFPLAVLGGNVDIIKTLHACEANVNCFSLRGETPLSIAVKSSRHDIVSLLIDWGVNVNQPDLFSHKLPSFICVETDNLEVLKKLLTKSCDVNLVDIYGRSSSMLKALMSRKRDIINLMLQIDSEDNPFHMAILNNDVDSLISCLENENINSQTRNGFTPLHYATQVNGTVMMRSLLGDEGVSNENQINIPMIRSIIPDINSKNKNGLTPLHLAVLNDHIEAVEVLVQRDADVNIKDDFGRIPLHYAQISAISLLLLSREIPSSVVTYSHNCSLVSENQSNIVTVHTDSNQIDLTLAWCTIMRNVTWFVLPFKALIYRGSINQPDHHGNTPLHTIVQALNEVHLSIKDNWDTANNIKIFKKNGGNIHLRNDDGYLPSDILPEQNDLQDLFTSSMSSKNRYRDEVVRNNILLCFIILCYVLGISPLMWALSNILNEYNFFEISTTSNGTNIEALLSIRQRVHDLIMHYIFLIGAMCYSMTCVVVIQVGFQLWNTNWRYRIASLILFFMMQCSAVSQFVVYDKTFTIVGFTLVCLVFSCNIAVALNMKELLSLKMKILQTMFLIIFFVHGLIGVLLSVGTILVFYETHLNNETLVGDIQNGSLANRVYFVMLSTNANSTEVFNVPNQDYTEFNYTLGYITFISLGMYIFQIYIQKRHIPSSKNKIVHNVIRTYSENVMVILTFDVFGILFVMIMYWVKMRRILIAMYN